MDKDVIALRALASSKPIVRKRRTGVEDVQIFKATRKTKLTLCLIGMWTVDMPPYNLARLAAVTRAAGYKTDFLDYNIDAFVKMKKKYPEVAKTFNPAHSHPWLEERNYNKKIFPYYKEYLDSYIEELANLKSDIVGFSLYWTNHYATYYVAERLRERNPNITIIFGGPSCNEQAPNLYEPPDFCDYYFVGESEQNILDFLEKYENNDLPDKKKIGALYSDTRINLDTLPYPDYDGLPLAEYNTNYSVVSEFSRGCVARCNYCSEVWYWKFRDRAAKKMVDEIEYQYNKYHTRFIYYADSLINGNLKEFRSYCEELVERNLEGLSWWAYARADGRMDLEFFKLIKKAGGVGFNFGFESGSDKVLKAINKKNTVAEINQNIIDCDKAGIKVSALMIFGAPGEEIADLSHTMNLLWNHRKRIEIVSLGFGLGDNPGTAYDNRKIFNISDRDNPWLGRWYTLDLKNTGAHRFLRAKFLNILVDIGNKNSVGEEVMFNNSYNMDMSPHYEVKFKNPNADNYVENEFDFNYEPIETNLGPFADSLMNECFSLLRTLWKARGAYEIKIKFSPELDDEDFDSVKPFNYFEYNSVINFKIDDDGNYEIKNTYRYKDIERSRAPNGRSGTKREFIDESFEYEYTDSGKWV